MSKASEWQAIREEWTAVLKNRPQIEFTGPNELICRFSVNETGGANIGGDKIWLDSVECLKLRDWLTETFDEPRPIASHTGDCP